MVPLAQLAEPLLARGHAVHLVLRDLAGARAALGALAEAPALRLWQAPLWSMPLQAKQPPASYAELLFHAGYLDAQRLLGLVHGWRSLLDTIAPDLLLADHAPTALLAARGRPLRRVLAGNGFFQPPARQPLPNFRDWEPVPATRLAQAEALALRTCNAVLAACGTPPLAALHELLAADETFLLTWPELDHYGSGAAGRPGAGYWGALPARGEGLPAQWPAGDGPALFAYLKGDQPGLDALLGLLAWAPWRTLAHVPGLPAALRQRHAGPRLQFSAGPVAMADALAQAQAVLCNAGSGTVFAALLSGRPLLLLPMHVEQLIVARRACATGAAEMLLPGDAAAGLLPALQRLLADGAPRRAALALAAKYGPDAGQVAQRVADRCEALLADAS